MDFSVHDQVGRRPEEDLAHLLNRLGLQYVPVREDVEDGEYEPGMVTTVEPQSMHSTAEGDISLSLEEDILVTSARAEIMSAEGLMEL